MWGKILERQVLYLKPLEGRLFSHVRGAEGSRPRALEDIFFQGQPEGQREIEGPASNAST